MDIFEENRKLLIAMTYRILGSFSEAEEVVQEVAIEWIKSDVNKLTNPKAWLVKVATNKALDALKKAYKKREVYTGVWLPEVLPESLIYWEENLDKGESLKTSFLLLLENLSPKERVVYLLKLVYEYSHSEIAAFLEISEANSRKIFQKAKESIEALNNDYDEVDDKSLAKIQNLFMVIASGDSEQLLSLLSEDSELWSDGGGKVSAARSVIASRERIAHFIMAIFNRAEFRDQNYKYDFTYVNKSAGLVLSKQTENGSWQMETIFSFELAQGKITRVYAQRNPDKLTFLKGFINQT